MYLSGINHLLYNVFKSVQNTIKRYVLLYQKRNNFTISQRKCSYPQNMHNHAKVASLVAQLVKNPPAMQKTLVQFWGWEDPLEKGPWVPYNPPGDPLGTRHGKTGKPSSVGRWGARRCDSENSEAVSIPSGISAGVGRTGPLATLRVVLGFQSVVLIPRYKISTWCTGLRISASPVETWIAFWEMEVGIGEGEYWVEGMKQGWGGGGDPGARLHKKSTEAPKVSE